MSLENCSNEHTIDFIAKSFFIFMISLSLVNDAFSLKDMIIENEFVKNNVKKFNDTSELFKYFLSNKEKKTRNGYIIKNETNEKQLNNEKKQDQYSQINNKNNSNNNNSNNNINNTSSSKQKFSSEQVQILNSTKLKKKKMSYQNDLIEEVDDLENNKETSSKIIEKKKSLNEPKIKVSCKKNVKVEVKKKDTTSNLHP